MIPYGAEGRKKLSLCFFKSYCLFDPKEERPQQYSMHRGKKNKVLLAALLSPLVWLQEGRRKAQMASNKIP